jgi:hypothetical protein
MGVMRKTANDFNRGDKQLSQDFSHAPLEHKSRAIKKVLLPYQHASWQSLIPTASKLQVILPELFRQMAR